MSSIKRRSFLTGSAGSLWAAGARSETPQASACNVSGLAIEALPNFCAHEHWGSLEPIGADSSGFRADTEAGALPTRPMGVWDLVLDPYLGGWIAATGVHWDALAKQQGKPDFRSWWLEAPGAALAAMRPHLERQSLSGAFQCIRNGVRLLHGVDIAVLDAPAWQAADQAIAESSRHLFDWYPAAMKKTGFSALIRPVHPEYYLRTADPSAAEKERAFTRTVLRIDPLLELGQGRNPRHVALAEAFEVELGNAAGWRRFLDRLFARAEQGGAVGIKQLQAYRRSLAFAPRKDAEVVFRGTLNPEQERAFQDWVVHECCVRANDRGWPHQIHVGTHNLEESSPLPLDALARRYGGMKLVLLHCWPFIEEAGWLAKHLPNVYLDSCWQAILNPAFLREALSVWLNYVPVHKLMGSHDATSVEMAAGASLFLREILAERLTALGSDAVRDCEALRRMAAAFLQDNAVSVYLEKRNA